MTHERDNNDRRKSAATSLAAYNAGDDDDPFTTIGDLMADLLHLAYAESGQSMDETENLHARIWRHFMAEIAEEQIVA